MQQLSCNVTIPIPSDSVLISKAELKQLKDHELTGLYWNMKDLEKKVNRKNEWIKENILYPHKFREILDVDSGGFVYYPKSKGQTWSFHAKQMADFLDKNFQRIFTNNDIH
jgi:phage pi2 protein 07